MFVLFSNEHDPGMRYEGLARTAFDCQKWGGPNGIAHQEFYNNFVLEITEEAKEAIKQILLALINRTSGDVKEHLHQIMESLTVRMSQETGIELIDYIIKICEEDI
jgi:hypothetical protein